MSDREILELLVKNTEQMNSKIEQMDKKIEQMNKKIGNIDSKVQQMDRKTGNMDSKVQQMDRKMGNIDSKVQQMDTQLNENTQLTKAILHRQEETDAKLDNLTFHHHKLYGEVIGLKETVNAIKRRNPIHL